MMLRRAALALAVSLLSPLGAAASEPDAASDAPVGVPAPAALNWRAVPVAGGGLAPSATPSRGMLSALKSAVDEEPAGAGRTEVSAALEALIIGADTVAPSDRQAYIDGHLGELNAAVRGLGKDAPKSLALKAAGGAAALNVRAERWEEARDIAELALAYDSEDKDALIARSQASGGLGDYARAYADADAVLRRTPDSAAAWTARSAADYGLGNYLQAVEDARRALAIDPNDKTAFALMKLSEGRSAAAPKFENAGLSASVEREYHGMTQQLNQVESVRRFPLESVGDRSSRRFLESAGSRLAVKDYDGAIADADKALAANPDDADALFYRAAAANLQGRYSDAERDATKGLTVAPSKAQLRDARAWAYIRMGRFTDAISDANHSLEIDPKNPYAFANRGHAYEGRGDYEAMAADLKAASELNAAFEPDYRDSTRRHGVAAKPLERDRAALSAAQKVPSRARSFALVLFFSLIGGLLIGLGLMHVGAGVRDRVRGKAGKSFEDRYELGGELGHGGMGVVYEARDRALKRRVAVKMLRDEYQLDDSAKKAFVEEARTVAELHHPSIVDIHGVEQDDRGLYLIFERLEGRTLDDVLAEKKRLPLHEVKRILGHVCSALSYAHERDVVHRDLKPGNVMLTNDGGVKVLDFGISRHTARAGKAATTTQTVVGTPHYMAPEQEYGFVRRENDIFALGAVLYEMVTGVRPYDGPTPAKLAKSYVRASKRVHGLSPELDALIDRALEPDPDKRLSSTREFAYLLENAHEGRPQS